MSDRPLGPGWWQASDGRYYPPETSPDWSTVGPQDAPPPTDPYATNPNPTGPYGNGTATPPGGPWSGAYPHGPYAYGAAPPSQGTNGLAIASLACSLLGLCTCISALVGIVLGHVALSQLNRPDNYQEGRGLAIAGLAVGYATVGLTALWFLFVIVAG